MGGEREECSEMKICPKCQAKNVESNQSCKKCGASFPDSSLQAKKEKVLGGKSRAGRLLPFLIIAVIVLGGVAYWVIQGLLPKAPQIGSQKVLESINYTGQSIRMTDFEA
jgi:ribosomal protein L40E